MQVLTPVAEVAIMISDRGLVSPELIRDAIRQAQNPEAYPEAGAFLEKLRVFYFQKYSLYFPSQSDAISAFLEGKLQKECAEISGAHPGSVSKWISQFVNGAAAWLKSEPGKDARLFWAIWFCSRVHGFEGSGLSLTANTCTGCIYRRKLAADGDSWLEACK